MSFPLKKGLKLETFRVLTKQFDLAWLKLQILWLLNFSVVPSLSAHIWKMILWGNTKFEPRKFIKSLEKCIKTATKREYSILHLCVVQICKNFKVLVFTTCRNFIFIAKIEMFQPGKFCEPQKWMCVSSGGKWYFWKFSFSPSYQHKSDSEISHFLFLALSFLLVKNQQCSQWKFFSKNIVLRGKGFPTKKKFVKNGCL